MIGILTEAYTCYDQLGQGFFPCFMAPPWITPMKIEQFRDAAEASNA